MPPLIVIMGGAKISTKLGAVKALMERADRILIGGAMANTFLKADGKNIGQSTYEEDQVENAGAILKASGDKLQLPVDGIVVFEVRTGAIRKIKQRRPR